MTAPELIVEVLDALRRQFYADRPVAEYFRDERALKGAISRYGYICHDRGWEFDAPFVLSEIINVVQVVKRQQVSGYLPVYLQAAIDRHCRERAEELSAKAKDIRRNAEKSLGKMRVMPEGAVRQPSATELLALLHQDIKRATKARKAKPSSRSTKSSQGELL